MQVVLVMFTADGERRSFSLSRDVTVLGRREDCDLRIPLSDVSRKHCRFIKDGDQLRIEDLGSSNGTYHNGQRIQESVVKPGDTVQIGPVAFIVQIDGVPADDELQPSGPADETQAPAGTAEEEPVAAAQPAKDELNDTPQELPAVAADAQSADEEPLVLEDEDEDVPPIDFDAQTRADQPALDLDEPQDKPGA